MIIWLASYPRSGNSLLRLMLKTVWNLNSFSIYGDGGDLEDPSVARLVGHESLTGSFPAIYPQLLEADRFYPIKTHEIPIDHEKAIYVVRDGRAASRSYCHYRRAFNGCSDESSTLRDVIVGCTPYGSWSNHLDLWNPTERPNTLVVKYEQMLAEPAVSIAQIAAFLTIEPKFPWRNSFDELARREPRYFRAGATNRPHEALSGTELELFWALHGPWMRRLGYAHAESSPAGELSEGVRRSVYLSVVGQLQRVSAAERRANQLADEVRTLQLEMKSHGAARQPRRDVETPHQSATRSAAMH